MCSCWSRWPLGTETMSGATNRTEDSGRWRSKQFPLRLSPGSLCLAHTENNIIKSDDRIEPVQQFQRWLVSAGMHHTTGNKLVYGQFTSFLLNSPCARLTSGHSLLTVASTCTPSLRKWNHFRICVVLLQAWFNRTTPDRSAGIFFGGGGGLQIVPALFPVRSEEMKGANQWWAGPGGSGGPPLI